MNPRIRQSGLSLIEVMIAIVIVSVGLLGIAGLQLKGLQYSNESHLRNQAVLQVLDMADRMRANIEGVADADYDQLEGMPTGTQPDCSSGDCSAAQVALLDHFQWEAANQSLFPSGTGVVCHGVNTLAPLDCSGVGDVYSIIVYWDEDRSGATGKGCDPDDASDMQCFRMNLVL
jgi:type IV pilus assembly protein PilV